jgi:hypothetical protein
MTLHTAQYAKKEVENWSLCRSEQAHNAYSCSVNIVYAKVGLARNQYWILTFSLIIDKGEPLAFTESLSQSSFWRKTSSPERVIARGTSNVTVTTVCTDQQVTFWKLPQIKEKPLNGIYCPQIRRWPMLEMRKCACAMFRGEWRTDIIRSESIRRVHSLHTCYSKCLTFSVSVQ